MNQTLALFETGKQFPDEGSIERLSKYVRGKAYFHGKQMEIYERATDILKETPHAEKLKQLYIACNIIDPLTTKPADMMFGEPPTFESGKMDDTEEQKAINRLVEENDINQMGHELVIGSGIRGDSWLKVSYDYRQDYSEYEKIFGKKPDEVLPEVLIEAVPAQFVFPEVSKRNRKKFKAINIAYISYEDIGNEEVAFLNVERHIPGWIFYKKFRVVEHMVDNSFDANIQIYNIMEEVYSGYDKPDETGLPFIPLFHAPYKSLDDEWQGKSNIEPVESLLSAINDRLVQIDYILWKHSDPNAYGPPAGVDQIKSGGRYIPVETGDVIPGYMEWNSQLEAAFKELDRLIGMVFAICETPQWIFGSTITELDTGGTGTSHTDGAAIKSRFMPIIKKVERIRVHVDKALRDALWTAQLMEQFVIKKYNVPIPKYEPQYPKIIWKDGLPVNKKEEAETMETRINSGTIDKLSAIKQLENMDDDKARMILEAINKEKEENMKQMVEQASFDAAWDEGQESPQEDQNGGDN